MTRCAIDEAACQGHALCVFEADSLFRIRESSGKAELLVDDIPDDQIAALYRARGACPERAIEVIEP
jgi:ferredoxin